MARPHSAGGVARDLALLERVMLANFGPLDAAAIAAILSILIFGGIIAALILFAIHH